MQVHAAILQLTDFALASRRPASSPHGTETELSFPQGGKDRIEEPA